MDRRLIRRLAVLALLAGAALVGLLLLRPSGDAPALEPTRAGSPAQWIAPSARRLAPALEGAMLQGSPSDAQLGRGTPRLVNFWASWCTPCRQEAPELARYARGPNPAPLVGVATTDATDDARAFLRRYDWTFPNVLDTNGSLARRYDLLGIPTTVIIDADGRIAAVLAGPQTEATLEAAARRVSEEQ